MSGPGYSNLLKRYRRCAPAYDRRYARYSQGTLGRSLALVPERATDLLDIACGTGLFESMLRESRPRLRITGVDLSPEMLDRARERFAGDPNISFVVGSAERLPFADASFDVIACNNAFHLVQDGSAALREFRRVLRPAGRVIIVDWCRNAPHMAAMVALFRLTDRQVRRLRSVESLVELMESEGFTVTHRERFRVRPMWGMMAVVGSPNART
jgi:ubiquinone/menaquinone biosynthesis C-methylase UbiE